MNLPESEIEFVEMRGLDIPDSMTELTNGSMGLMMYWLERQRNLMGCVVLKHNGKAVAWCAHVMRGNEHYSLGTYVASEYRTRGIGKELVSRALDMIARISPGGTVRCGGALHAEFESTYARLIESKGLQRMSIFDKFSEEFETYNVAA